MFILHMMINVLLEEKKYTGIMVEILLYLYYPLTLENATASGDTSEYNNKNYAKVGSNIILNPDTPQAGHSFDKWEVFPTSVTVGKDNKFTMPNKAITVAAQYKDIASPVISDIENGTKEIELDDTVIAVNAWEQTVLRLQDTATKTSIKLKWNAVPEADGYVIYWNKCGAKNGFKQVKVIGSGKTLSWIHKNRKKNTRNKYYVKAYKVIYGKKSFIKTSNKIHLVTKGGKYTNVKKLKSKVSGVTLNQGKAKKLKITQIYAEKNKKIVKHMRALTYTTSDKKVATVT